MPSLMDILNMYGRNSSQGRFFHRPNDLGFQAPGGGRLPIGSPNPNKPPSLQSILSNRPSDLGFPSPTGGRLPIGSPNPYKPGF